MAILDYEQGDSYKGVIEANLTKSCSLLSVDYGKGTTQWVE